MGFNHSVFEIYQGIRYSLIDKLFQKISGVNILEQLFFCWFPLYKRSFIRTRQNFGKFCFHYLGAFRFLVNFVIFEVFCMKCLEINQIDLIVSENQHSRSLSYSLEKEKILNNKFAP